MGVEVKRAEPKPEITPVIKATVPVYLGTNEGVVVSKCTQYLKGRDLCVIVRVGTEERHVELADLQEAVLLFNQ